MTTTTPHHRTASEPDHPDQPETSHSPSRLLSGLGAKRHPVRRDVWPDGGPGAADADTPDARAPTEAGGSTAHIPPRQHPLSAAADAHLGHHAHQPHDASSPSAGAAPYSLSRRDDALLRAVATYHFLTAEQLTRLDFRPGSLAYVRAKLKRLADAGYLDRLRLPSATAGNAPWVFTLATAGIRYLTAGAGGEDVGALRWFRPIESHERSYLFLAHTLAVNEALIAAALLSRAVPDIVVAQMRHERDLRREPVTVVTASNDRMGIVLDGWLDLHLVSQRTRLCLGLELDRGTVEQRAWKKKLRGLLAYADGPYQRHFGTDSLTVLIVATTGPGRCREIRRWCEQVLRELHREADADLFLLTSLPEGTIPDPQTLFLTPVWQQPLRPDLLPLIALPPSSPSEPSASANA